MLQAEFAPKVIFARTMSQLIVFPVERWPVPKTVRVGVRDGLISVSPEAVSKLDGVHLLHDSCVRETPGLARPTTGSLPWPVSMWRGPRKERTASWSTLSAATGRWTGKYGGRKGDASTAVTAHLRLHM